MTDINYTPIEVEYPGDNIKTKMLEYVKENKAVVATVGIFTIITLLVGGVLIVNRMAASNETAQTVSPTPATGVAAEKTDVKSATDKRIASPSATLTRKPTAPLTRPPTRTPTKTPSPSPTSNATIAPTNTATPEPTNTTAPTNTPQPTNSPTLTPNPTATYTPTPTATPIPATPTPTETAVPTPSGGLTPP